MNDTPETDALHAEYMTCQESEDDFMERLWKSNRKLEQERDEARAMVRDQRNQLEKASPARLLYQSEDAIDCSLMTCPAVVHPPRIEALKL